MREDVYTVGLHASASVLVRERSLVLRSHFSRSQYGKKQLVSFRRVVPHSEQLHVVEVGHAGVLRMRTIVAQSPHFVSEIGNKSVPIQLTQCWFPGLAISSAKIKILSNCTRKRLWFEISKMLIAVLTSKFTVSFRHNFVVSFC